MGIEKSVARSNARKLAEKFGGAGEDSDAFREKFDAMWDLTWRANEYDTDNHADMLAEVRANLNALRAVVFGADTSASGAVDLREIDGGRDHLRTYRTLPAAGRHVVFSDIHITDKGNRQDFFDRANKALYLDVLRSHYSPGEFTLIENGDVEELLIFEPVPGAMPDFEKDDWQVIFDDRETRKRAQFRRILADHADYYQTVHTHFVARDAYFHTIGNHDHDLARADYVDDIADVLGLAFPQASDMVMLTRDGAVADLICHGHQFDTVCCAKHAAHAGESYSQGGAWAYQGPDRHWTILHDGPEFITPWREGDKAFNNSLVTALPGSTMSQFVAALGKFFGTLDDDDNWEALFGKNVAWEYFTSDSAEDAFRTEVETGIRWYKYRHMDEIEIVDWLDTLFGPDGVRLTLGHSHEPRLNAGKPAAIGGTAARAANYLNAAAAGRFENLVWGIEFDDGTATLVSWSREPDGRLRRTVWEDGDLLHVRFLRAASHDLIDVVDPDAPPVWSVPPLPISAITNLLLN